MPTPDGFFARKLAAVMWRLGWQRRQEAPPAADDELADLSESDRAIVDAVQPYTMTSPARLASLLESVRHLARREIPGDFVECGVWRGGSAMAMALALQQAGDTARNLHLFDTFEGMPPPSEKDRAISGESAATLLDQTPRGTGVWCHADLADVTRNLESTGYPASRLHYVVGKVEDTLPARAPERIALLRLDTDWFESTRHELRHLYPRVEPGGIVIIDDYGHWSGARAAVDEFFATLPRPPFLHRIDYTGRLFVKPAA